VPYAKKLTCVVSSVLGDHAMLRLNPDGDGGVLGLGLNLTSSSLCPSSVSPPPPRAVGRPLLRARAMLSLCQCVLDAEWCLQSDAIRCCAQSTAAGPAAKKPKHSQHSTGKTAAEHAADFGRDEHGCKI